MENFLGTNQVTQIAIIVKNIEVAAKKYADFLGLAMPDIITTSGYEHSKTEYRGQKCDATAKLAFLKIGDGIDLELIEPDGKPSVWQEHLEKYGEGVHHIAFNIKDTQAKIEKAEANDMPLIQKGEYEGGRYAYFDATESLKLCIETLEND